VPVTDQTCGSHRDVFIIFAEPCGSSDYFFPFLLEVPFHSLLAFVFCVTSLIECNVGLLELHLISGMMLRLDSRLMISISGKFGTVLRTVDYECDVAKIVE
jgi:hypothetical protein